MAETRKPVLIVVGGPNGSGKSTLTASKHLPDYPVIDPDAIARTLSPEDPGKAAVSAGREAMRQQNDAIAGKASFIVETTLSGNQPLRLMEKAHDAGYEVELHYTRVGTPELNIKRIEARVADGGHHIPDEDVRRRYHRSLDNLPQAIAIADKTVLYDNSGARYQVVATLSKDQFGFAEGAPRWAARAAYEAACIQYQQANSPEEYDQALERQAEAAVAAGAMQKDELVEIRKQAQERNRDLDDDLDLD